MKKLCEQRYRQLCAVPVQSAITASLIYATYLCRGLWCLIFLLVNDVVCGHPGEQHGTGRYQGAQAKHAKAQGTDHSKAPAAEL